MATSKQLVELDVALRKAVGYSYYKSNVSLIERLYLKNNSHEPLANVEVKLESQPEFLLPFSKLIPQLPADSTVEIDTGNQALLSPYFLCNVNSTTKATVKVTVSGEKKYCVKESTVTLLPYDVWRPEGEFVDLLAGFVKPRHPEITRLKTTVKKFLADWKLPTDIDGYVQSNKTSVRQLSAAIYATLQWLQLEPLKEQSDFRIRNYSEILQSKKATMTEIAVLYSACAESCGLHPVILVGEGQTHAGVWLYDNCMLDSYTNDRELLKKLTSEGINDLSTFDISALYQSGILNYTGAEKSYYSKLDKPETFSYCVDIKRCRAGGVRPLPERVIGENGAQLFTETDTDITSAPKDIETGKVLDLKNTVSREKQWERRLLDLSQRNMLLHFRPSVSSLHVLNTNLAETISYLLDKRTFTVSEMPPDIGGVLAKSRNFDTPATLKSFAELNTIELKNKRLRTFVDKNKLKTTLNTLYRRERTALEEMGADPLYLATGFLKWYEKQDSIFPKYAPLVLFPVTLIRKEGGKGYSLQLRDEGFQINTTLLEFLKQEFNIDLRGLDVIQPEEFNINNIIASVRNKIVSMHGWDVVEDVHLAIFSFTRYLMWSDIRNHIDEFKKNSIVSALVDGKMYNSDKLQLPSADIDHDYKPQDLMLPIVADSSQFEAVSASHNGNSFVLHGPPGTGKSQTITNIIADALANGKRVLFVAEKMAALSVVKQRLDSIGIGDFCLELHSNKADKTEICEKLLNTLESKQKVASDFNDTAQKYQQLRDKLCQAMDALHYDHTLGSIYNACLEYLRNADAPDVMEIDSAFADDLTKDKLQRYETLLTELAVYARECGEVHHSPFNDLEITEYKTGMENSLSVYCTVMIEETQRLKSYISHISDLFGMRIRVLTKTKLDCLNQLCNMLLEANNAYRTLFADGNTELAVLLDNYGKTMLHHNNITEQYLTKSRVIPEPNAKIEILRQEFNTAGIHSNGKLKGFIKRIQKYSNTTLDDKSIEKMCDLALCIWETEQQCEEMAKQLASKLGLSRRQMSELENFSEQLQRLYGLASDVFAEFNVAQFNNACSDLYINDNTLIVSKFIESCNSFYRQQAEFFKKFNINSDYSVLDCNYPDFIETKCRALRDNVDLFDNWCKFYSTSAELNKLGLSFTVQPLLDGTLTSDNLLSCFKKKIYNHYITTTVSEDEVLNQFSSAQIEDKIEKFRQINDTFLNATRTEILRRLVEGVPDVDTEGKLSLEIVALQKTAKSSAHSYTLRKLFDDIPNLLSKLAPCMLMSPISVAQYIAPVANTFDLVVFDEASQLPTAEAVGAIARGKTVIVVGDPKQLPPTSFFNTDYVDEENLDLEDLESVLDDCMALGLPQKHLLWHYRSRHESLIAFPNLMYYGNKLHTFPSPDSMDSKVTLRYLPDGVYDRGVTKQNKKEAEALTEEVKRRLTDKNLCKQSIGIVTFSTAQQVAVESAINTMLVKNKLENIAYDREEPLFVKNLENIQGDERDVILFSVGYGPDSRGYLLLNFGPLNQKAGWRRLNVAVSRAREEMIVFSSMTSAMIDLSRTNSKGVQGLKRFLEFAAGGKSMLAVNANDISVSKHGIGKQIAKELRKQGIECRYDLGVSDFKIDVAVADPRNKKKFLLAILCDGVYDNSVKDKFILQTQTLKRLNWNVMRVWTLNYYNNPKREIRRIKDYIAKLLETGKKPANKTVDKYLRAYTTANIRAENVQSDYLFEQDNEKSILQRMTAIVEKESPLSTSFLIKRTLNSYGIVRSGSKINKRMTELVAKLKCNSENINGTTFLRGDDSCLQCNFYRPLSTMKLDIDDISPYEVVAASRSVLEDRIALPMEELVVETAQKLGYGKNNNALLDHVKQCILYGVRRSILIVTANGKITKA